MIWRPNHEDRFGAGRSSQVSRPLRCPRNRRRSIWCNSTQSKPFVISPRWPSGGIGRRARFRCVCRKVCGFESRLGHRTPRAQVCVAERLGTGLQNQGRRFESARRLKSSQRTVTQSASEYLTFNEGVAGSSPACPTAKAHTNRPDGGIGRHASLRDWFPKGIAGSNPVLGTRLRSVAKW